MAEKDFTKPEAENLPTEPMEEVEVDELDDDSMEDVSGGGGIGCDCGCALD